MKSGVTHDESWGKICPLPLSVPVCVLTNLSVTCTAVNKNGTNTGKRLTRVQHKRTSLKENHILSCTGTNYDECDRYIYLKCTHKF